MNSEKFDSLKTKRKEKKAQIRKMTRKRDLDTHQKRFQDFEIGPKFSQTHVS